MKNCKKKNPIKVIKMNKEDFVNSENLEIWKEFDAQIIKIEY